MIATHLVMFKFFAGASESEAPAPGIGAQKSNWLRIVPGRLMR